MCAYRRLRSAPSLIRVFAVRMKKPWVLNYPLSAQWRLWSDWADAQADLSLLGAQSFCWFCHEAAHYCEGCSEVYFNQKQSHIVLQRRFAGFVILLNGIALDSAEIALLASIWLVGISIEQNWDSWLNKSTPLITVAAKFVSVQLDFECCCLWQ